MRRRAAAAPIHPKIEYLMARRASATAVHKQPARAKSEKLKRSDTLFPNNTIANL